MLFKSLTERTAGDRLLIFLQLLDIGWWWWWWSAENFLENPFAAVDR